jgi:hypothetical protein
MKRVALLLTVALAMTLACAGLALAQDAPTPSQGQGPPEGVIPGQYIVVFKDEVQDPTAVARAHAQRHGAEILFTYQHSIQGYAARLHEGRLNKVRADEQVAYVEPDKTTYAQAQTLPWGINRIDADASSTDAGNGSGAVSNVNAYIIDSGMYRHTDLNVVGHVNFAGGKNTDCNGHGTHVAGTVAARDNTSYVVGAAPGAPLTGVKVLSGGEKKLVGGSGNEVLYGGRGSDIILGNKGNDLLIGNDFLSGNAGEYSHPVKDTLSGGGGNDVFGVENDPAGKDVVTCGGILVLDDTSFEQANGGPASASGNRKRSPQHHPLAGSHSTGGLADRPAAATAVGEEGRSCRRGGGTQVLQLAGRGCFARAAGFPGEKLLGHRAVLRLEGDSPKLRPS